MSERRRVPVSPKTGEPILPPDPTEVAAEGCLCPRLDRADWHEVESDWSDITFLETHARALAGVPVGFASARDQLERRAASLELTVPEDGMLLLGPGRLRRPLLLEVEGADDVTPGVERPGGIAFSRLVPAHMGQMGRAVDETRAIARERYGRDPDAVLVWYLTCRLCSSERDYETLIVAHYRDGDAAGA